MTIIIDGTNGITQASWATASRPGSPGVGDQGFNTTLNILEVWNGSTWVGTQTWNSAGITSGLRPPRFTAMTVCPSRSRCF